MSEFNIAYIEYSPATNSLDIFMCGCNPPHCKGCYNAELWDFNAGGLPIDVAQDQIIGLNSRFDSLIDRILILGGEPLDVYQKNPDKFQSFIDHIRVLTGKPVYLFTRYPLSEVPQELKPYFEYIKCGRYVEELTTDDNIQEGIKLATSNQKIYKQGVDY